MIRAAVLTAPGTLEIASFPESAPPRDGAVLRPTHCGVCGTDPHMYSGHLAVPMPLVMGHEFAGVLEDWGPDFPARDVYGQELRRGDQVAVGTTLACGTCWFCRFLPQRENLCQAVNIYGITLGAEEAPHVRGGYSDLVYLLPQTWLFKLPPNVTLAMAGRFGFDEVLSLQELVEVEDRVRAVRSLTRGLGADVVVEVVGLPAAFAESLRLVRKGGRVVEFGHFTDNGTMALNPQQIVNLDVDILGSYAYPNSQLGTSLAFLSRYADVYPFEDLVTHTFAVEDTEQAIKASRDKLCVKAMVVADG